MFIRNYAVVAGLLCLLTARFFADVQKPATTSVERIPSIVGYWYMGTATGFDCNLRIDANHTLQVQYGGCFHQDPPLAASWKIQGDKVRIIGSQALNAKLGTFLLLTRYKGNVILVPERENVAAFLNDHTPHYCFWKNLLGSKGLQLPKEAEKLM